MSGPDLSVAEAAHAKATIALDLLVVSRDAVLHTADRDGMSPCLITRIRDHYDRRIGDLELEIDRLETLINGPHDLTGLFLAPVIMDMRSSHISGGSDA